MIQENQQLVLTQVNVKVVTLNATAQDSRQKFIRCWPDPYSNPFRRLQTIALIASLCIAFTTAKLIRAQNQTTRINGFDDQDVTAPATTGILGQTDAAALLEIQQYLNLTGSIGCQTIQGSGTIQYEQPDGARFPVTLSMQRGMGFRLDATTEKGIQSTRIFGSSGVTHDADGTVERLLPETAVTGLVQIQTLPCAVLAARNASFVDHGISSANHLHRISLESGLTPGLRNAAANKTSVIDFYFDPTSHLLLKSVTSIQISGARYQNFIRTITYSDYRSISDALIPFHYQESLNGEPIWTLQLSLVQVDVKLPASYFKF